MRIADVVFVAAFAITPPAMAQIAPAQQKPDDASRPSVSIISDSMIAQAGRPQSATPQPGPSCAALAAGLKGSTAAMDDRLANLVRQMNEATGQEKVDRMAAVIEELIAQRTQTREQLADLMPRVITHVLQHVQNSLTVSVAECSVLTSEKTRATALAQPEH